MIIPKTKLDQMQNMIELRNDFFMAPLWLKGLHRKFPTNNELLWDVEMKNGDLGDGKKKVKKPSTPLVTKPQKSNKYKISQYTIQRIDCVLRCVIFENNKVLTKTFICPFCYTIN